MSEEVRRTCKKCGEEDLVTNFYTYNRNGVIHYGYTCMKCHRKRKREERKKPHRRDAISEYEKEYRSKNNYNSKYYKANRERISAQNTKWRKANKEWYDNYKPLYYLYNKDEFVARTAKRRARKLKATPSWLTDEHVSQMKDIYAHARDCIIVTGEEYRVDHIVPLQGRDVCGLHVPWNLQVLPSDVNLSKSNKLVVDR